MNGLKDYSKLDKHIVMLDMGEEDWEEPDIELGVAIPSERADGFCREVERLAVERFGGATFEELLENDSRDEAAGASSRRVFQRKADDVIAAAEAIIRGGL